MLSAIESPNLVSIHFENDKIHSINEFNNLLKYANKVNMLDLSQLENTKDFKYQDLMKFKNLKRLSLPQVKISLEKASQVLSKLKKIKSVSILNTGLTIHELSERFPEIYFSRSL